MSAAAVTLGLFNLLNGSAALAALISTYEGQPSVFIASKPPEDAPLPYVQSAGLTSFPSGQALDGGLRAFDVTIEAYAEAKGDPLPIDALADQIAAVLSVPANLIIDGYRTVHTIVEGPVPIESDDDTYARSVAVRCMIYPT